MTKARSLVSPSPLEFEGSDFVLAGFELVGLNYTKIVPPGSINTFVTGISTAGKLVGYANIEQILELLVSEGKISQYQNTGRDRSAC